jgi:redox-sensing transcriptional repressor
MDLGIKGIVDFTHTHFLVKEGVEVQPVDVVAAIQELAIRMKANENDGNI